MKTMKNLRKKGRNALTKRRRSKKTKGGKRRRNKTNKTIKKRRKRGGSPYDDERKKIQDEYDGEMERARILYHNYNKRTDDDNSIRNAGIKPTEEHKERAIDFEKAEEFFLDAENTLKKKIKALNKKYKRNTGGWGVPIDESERFFYNNYGPGSIVEDSRAYPFVYVQTLIGGVNIFNNSYHQNSRGKIMLMEKIKEAIDSNNNDNISAFIRSRINMIENVNDKNDLLQHIRPN